MRNPKHFALLGSILICLASSACAADPVVSPVVEKRPYVGDLAVRAEVRNGAPLRRSGRGGAEFQPLSAGRSRLVVYGDLGNSGGDESQSGDAGFVVEGGIRDGSWVAAGGDLRLSIAPDGAISGGGLMGGDRYVFAGQVGSDAFDLTVQITPAAASRANANGIEGFVFDYSLRHQAQDHQTQASTESRRAPREARAKGSCRVIRYQPRMIANIGGDTMSSVQVPVCVD